MGFCTHVTSWTDGRIGLHADSPGLHQTPCGCEKCTTTGSRWEGAMTNMQNQCADIRVRWTRFSDCIHGDRYGGMPISGNVWMGNHHRAHFSFHTLPARDQARRYDRWFQSLVVRYVIPTGIQCAVIGHTDNKCVYHGSTIVIHGIGESQGGAAGRDVQDMDVTAAHSRMWLPTSLPSQGSHELLQASVTSGDERLRDVDQSPVRQYTTCQSRIIQLMVSQPITPQTTQWSHQGPSPRILQQWTPTSLEYHADQGISLLDPYKGDPSHCRPPVPPPIGLPMTGSQTGTRGILRDVGGNAAPVGSNQTVRIQDSPTARLPPSMSTLYNAPISHSNLGQDSGGGLWNHASGLRFSNSQASSRSKPKRMPNFDGKSSWSDYLVQFQIAARLNRWWEEDKAMELATSLVGQACGVLSDMSDRIFWIMGPWCRSYH